MAYIGNSPGVASQRVVTQFTATSNQTTFIPTSGYTIGYLDVFLNGVKLVNGEDYTASNGTTVVLAAGAASGDSVEVVSFIPRGLSDGWLKSEADSRYLQLGASFSGDVSGTYSAITLANSGVTAGSYGSATNIPAITVDSKGRITSVTNTAVSIPSGSLTFTGDVTGSGTTGSSTSLTLASVGTAGTYTKVTTDAKGRVTGGASLSSGDLPTYTGTLTSGQITTALAFTPENLANKAIANGYASLDSTGKVPTAQLSGFVDQTKPSIRPTLNLDFANSKIVDSRITFTRTTTASYYDQQGILKYAQPDEPRIDHDPSTGECRGLLIEEQRTNLVNVGDGRYKEIEASEGNDGLTVRDCAAIAPDGTMSAAFVAQDSGTPAYNYLSFTSLSRSGSTPIPINTTFTASIYVKSAGAGYFRMGAPWNASNYSGVQFNLTTGAVQVSYATTGTGYSLTNPFITPVGNGWYRVGFTGVVTAGASQPTFTPMLNVWDLSYSNWGSTGNGVDGVYVWGAQIELAPFATSKITVANTFTSRASSATYFDSTGILRLAGTNQPRYSYGYDIVSNKWVSQGLVLEEAATNIVQYSQFSSSAPINDWVQFGSYGSLTTAPDGLSSAIKLVTPSGSGVFGLTHKTVSLTSGTTYTASVFAKAGEWTRLGCRVYDGAQYLWHATVNLNDGSVLTGGSAVRTAYVGNGWWRCSFTGTSTITTSTYLSFECHNTSTAQSGETGDGTSGIYLWGAQLETGYVATSYIPTYGATATRAADVSSSAATTRANDLGLMSNTAWYTPDFTMAAEGYSISGNADVGGAPVIVAVDDGTTNNRIQLRRNRFGGSGSDSGFVYRVALNIAGSSYSIDGVVPYANIASYWANTGKHKTAMSIATNSQLFGADGFATSVSSITAPTLKNIQRLWVGWGEGGRYWNGHIAKIAFYPKNTSLSQLQALTQ